MNHQKADKPYIGKKHQNKKKLQYTKTHEKMSIQKKTIYQ